MSSAKLNTAFLLMLVCLAACSSAGSSSRREQTEPRAAWLRSHAHPVALEGERFDDLEFLRPLLEGKRVVQLGENSHGVRESNLVKARIVRFLHQELGYDVIAFESALYQCYDANLAAAEAPARTTLLSCAFGVWHTEELLPLFEYIRETRQGGRPLRLAGIDVQPIGSNKDDRPRFLSGIVARVDSAYATEVRALDSAFLEVYGRGARTFGRRTAGAWPPRTTRSPRSSRSAWPRAARRRVAWSRPPRASPARRRARWRGTSASSPRPTRASTSSAATRAWRRTWRSFSTSCTPAGKSSSGATISLILREQCDAILLIREATRVMLY